MLATVFHPPNARQTEIDLKNVYPEDEAFFQENNVSISLEDIGGMFVIYALCEGMEEEDELLVLSHGRSCQETLKELRVECVKYFSK